MSDRKPRVLLLEVEVRTSERTGRQWYSAWLGRCRLVGFEAEELNDRGHRVIKFYAEEPEPRPGGSPRPQSTGVRRGGDRYRTERQSQRARRGQAADDALARHGGCELDDEIPF